MKTSVFSIVAFARKKKKKTQGNNETPTLVLGTRQKQKTKGQTLPEKPPKQSKQRACGRRKTNQGDNACKNSFSAGNIFFRRSLVEMLPSTRHG